MDSDLLADAQAAAKAEGITLSTWLAQAAADRLRLKELRGLLDEWEAEHGPITGEEINAVERSLLQARHRATRRVLKSGVAGR